MKINGRDIYWIKLTEYSLTDCCRVQVRRLQDEKNGDARMGVVFKIGLPGGLQSVRGQDDDKCCLQNEVRLRG